MSIDTNHYVTSECSRATVHSHIEVLMCLYLLYVLLNTAHQQAVPYFPDNTNCIVYYKRNKSVLNWLLKETNSMAHYITFQWFTVINSLFFILHDTSACKWNKHDDICKKFQWLLKYFNASNSFLSIKSAIYPTVLVILSALGMMLNGFIISPVIIKRCCIS